MKSNFASLHIFNSSWLISNALLLMRSTSSDMLNERFSVSMFLATSAIDFATSPEWFQNLSRLSPHVSLHGPCCFLLCVVWHTPPYTWLLQMEKLEIKRFACDLTAVLGSILQHVLTVLLFFPSVNWSWPRLFSWLSSLLLIWWWVFGYCWELCVKWLFFMNLVCIGYLFLNFRVSSISVHLPR